MVVYQHHLLEASVAGAKKAMRALQLQLGISINTDIWVVQVKGIKVSLLEDEDRSQLQRPRFRA